MNTIKTKNQSMKSETINEQNTSNQNLKTSLLRNIKFMNDTSRLRFNILAGINRPINPGHVTKLATSLTKMGDIRPIVVAKLDFISGKPEYYIIDGQHLFNALLRNSIEIPYVVINTITNKRELVETIALLNASSKTWAMIDYVKSWSFLEDDYIKLNKYFNIYDFEISALAGILMGVDSKGVSLKIKSGSFKIINESEKVELLNHLTEALSIVPRMNRFENRYFCGEFVKFYNKAGNKYNNVKVMTYIKEHKDKFSLATQETDRLANMLLKAI